MRILIAHNSYQEKGGEDRVVEEEAGMLRRRGHEVELFLRDNESIRGPVGQISAAMRSVYSARSARELNAAIDRFRPDIIHVHNFLPNLSPSIFFAARSRHVPVVQTLHNYRMICANALLFRDGHICEECPTSGSFLPGIKHACYRRSRLGSAVVGGGMALHSIFGTWNSRVDRYIALTGFVAEKLSASRIPPDRIRIKPNFVADTAVGDGAGGYALFAGRLSPEKGLATLLEADREDLLPLPVKIAGDGPLIDSVRTAAARPGSRLEVLGAMNRDDLQQLMRDASVLVVPSLWYEPCPMVIIEALACGLPVSCSRLGGLPELVGEDQPELFFTAGDHPSLASALRQFAAPTAQLAPLRKTARTRFETNFSEAQNYAQLIAIYRELAPNAAV